MSAIAIVGLIVLAAALIVLLISLLHPEGRKRPGGYLDGQEPRPRDGDGSAD
ncbi:MAG TPA: hypothetical protein VN635_15760 [Conexibacter sp.]|nr:hypothetical protein [Conexibacter sp.]